MKRIFLNLSACLVLLLAAACSTTKRLPEGEQLYIGIGDIAYTDHPKDRSARRDTAGVITSIGEAVKAVDRVLKGEGTQAAPTLSDEQRAAIKARIEADRKDFETVQEEVEAVLAYPPNNALFGSSKLRSPLQFGLWFYNGLADSRSKLGRWMFRKLATEPVLVSSVSPEMRTKVATNTLHNYGFFHGNVGYEVVTQKNPRKAKINYTVTAGPLFRLDSVAYVGFPSVADSLLRRTRRRRLLNRGDAFSVVNLSGEQTRIEQLLRENGYYFFSAPYVAFRADTFQRKHHVQLRVQPAEGIPDRVKHPWYIGRTHITVREKAGDALTGKFSLGDFTFNHSGRHIPLKPYVWREAIVHRRGGLYRLRHQNTTIEKLNSLGVFSQLDVSYVPRDTTAACDTLDLYVTAVMDKLYDSNFEVNATFKSNQQVGPGVSFGLAKRNAFRGGEKVSFDIFGSYEWQTGAGAQGSSSLINSYELGTKLSFDFPRFVFPGVRRRYLRFAGSTTFALDADWKNRAGFFNMISFGASATYKWHKTRRLLHELVLLDLNFDKLLHTTADFDAIMADNPALYMSMRDQFVPAMSYTLTYSSRPRRRNPLWLQVSAKEAGNVVSAVYAATGKRFATRDKELFGNPFAQFVKLTFEAHKSFRLNPTLEIATRFFGGFIYSYGNSQRAPYAEQFYVGGANSVRGFAVRTVGPGSFRSDDSKYAYMDQTGDFKLEANAELRARLFGSLYGAVFLDAGNVWLLRADAQRPGGKFEASALKDIAVGTGLGLRYDLSFLVLRFDVGMALHAPYDTGRSGWYNIPRFGKGLAYHFAIGYPF